MPKRHRIAPFALAAALIAASGAAFAQTAPAPAAATYQPSSSGPAPAPGIKRGHRLDRALASLGLSSDQSAKIRGYRASYQASQSSATRQSRKALVAQIEGVLTPDQLARFKTAMQHHHAPAPMATQ